MNINVLPNRVCDDWTVTFLQSVSPPKNSFHGMKLARLQMPVALAGRCSTKNYCLKFPSKKKPCTVFTMSFYRGGSKMNIEDFGYSYFVSDKNFSVVETIE